MMHARLAPKTMRAKCAWSIHSSSRICTASNVGTSSWKFTHLFAEQWLIDMRAAIYARFSSELQDRRSIADQVSLARRYAEDRGHVVVKEYDDAAISGASIL